MISDSKLHMWRALFALAHADLIITQEERIFMRGVMEGLNLSPEQKALLEADTAQSQDALEMFKNIGDDADKDEFFHIAYDLVWIDGEHNVDEEKTLMAIKAYHEREQNGGAATPRILSWISHRSKATGTKGCSPFWTR